MAQNIKISVIVPAYNSEKTIRNCIEALLNQTFPKDKYEIIIVDDGSTDRTTEIIKNYNVRLIKSYHNGPAHARNIGANSAKGEILLFTDADCAPTLTWIEEMLKPFADSHVSAVKGAYLTQQNEPLAIFCQYEFEQKYKNLLKSKYIDFIDTYSAGVKREVFFLVGGFSERFKTPSCEDCEFAYRLVEHGYKIVFNPNARVYHQHPTHWLKYLRRKFRFGLCRAYVIFEHRTQSFRDTYTLPQLKLQIILFYLFVMGLIFTIKSKVFLGLSLGAIITLMLTDIKLIIKILRERPRVGIYAPFYLILRALGLSTGLAIGLCLIILKKIMQFMKR